MNSQTIDRILQDTAYVRTSGSEQELRCAEYLRQACAQLGLDARLEPFTVPMAAIRRAVLLADGKEIPCRGYLCAGSATVEAPLAYLPSGDPCSLDGCRGRIVLIDGHLGIWQYRDLLEHGAVGFITYDGDVHYADEDIDQRELRSYVSQGRLLPGVNINAKSAVALIRDGVKTVRIELEQDEALGQSHNVVCDLPGERDETIVLTAHYDSKPLSVGSYDNMSGCIALLGVAEAAALLPRRYGLRLIFCGSEERGLLGSKAYCAQHADALDRIVLNVNLDMLGSIMGQFIACCSCEERMVHFIEYFASLRGFGIQARQDVYSSDSTPFADKGVPSLSFARIAPKNTATIHNRYDTPSVLSADQLLRDIDFVAAFVKTMACARCFPVSRVIPDRVKDKLDIYLGRKRGSNA